MAIQIAEHGDFLILKLLLRLSEQYQFMTRLAHQARLKNWQTVIVSNGTDTPYLLAMVGMGCFASVGVLALHIIVFSRSAQSIAAPVGVENITISQHLTSTDL